MSLPLKLPVHVYVICIRLSAVITFEKFGMNSSSVICWIRLLDMNWSMPWSNLQASNIWFLSQSDGNISFYCKCFLLFSSSEPSIIHFAQIWSHPQAKTKEQQPLAKCWRWDKRGVHVWDERGHKSEMRGRNTSVPAPPPLSFSRLRLSQRTDSAARPNESCAQLYTNPDIKIEEMLTSLFNECSYKYFKLY